MTETAGFAKLPLIAPRRRLQTTQTRRLDAVQPKLLAILRALVEGKAPWPLLLHGPPGRGKTCAALALADICQTAGYWTCEELADVTMQRPPSDVESLWQDVATKDLVILDELGARAKVSDLGYSTVKHFADLREHQAERRAIYISNVAPRELAGLYDDRIASRIRCGTEFELTGEDRRRSR